MGIERIVLEVIQSIRMALSYILSRKDYIRGKQIINIIIEYLIKFINGLYIV